MGDVIELGADPQAWNVRRMGKDLILNCPICAGGGVIVTTSQCEFPDGKKSKPVVTAAECHNCHGCGFIKVRRPKRGETDG